MWKSYSIAEEEQKAHAYSTSKNNAQKEVKHD
jgi:hypothetical protein